MNTNAEYATLCNNCQSKLNANGSNLYNSDENPMITMHQGGKTNHYCGAKCAVAHLNKKINKESETSIPTMSPIKGGYEVDLSEGIAAQKKFGGVNRSDLQPGDYLFPADKSFPLKTPNDARDSLNNFGHSRYSKTMTYDEFVHKLWNKAKEKGIESGIPQSTRDKYNLK